MLKNYPTLLFILQRSVWYFLTFLVAITINFFLPRFGADPIDLIMSKQKGLNDQQARDKEVSYMKEFGLVDLEQTAVTDNGSMLMTKDGAPITFKQLSEKKLLTVNEQKSFWTASIEITDAAALKSSLLPILATKTLDGFEMSDTSVWDGDLFSETVRGSLSLEELKSLKGLSVEMNNKVYSLKATDLNSAFGGPVSVIEGKSPYVVTSNGSLKLFVNGEGHTPIPEAVVAGTAIADASVDVVIADQVLNTIEKRNDIERFEPVRTPLVKQYFKYIWMVLHGDLGTSFVKYPKKVNTIVAEAIPWTLALQFPTIVIGWIVGNLLGALAAYKRGLFDKVLFPCALLMNSIPFFAVGMILVYLFSETFRFFPSSGGYAIDVIPGFTWAFISSAAYFYVLPFFSIFPVFASGQATGMRTMGIYELGTGYVKYAKTLGIKENKILMYIFRNAMLPQLTGLALMLGVMIGGALITEMIFSYPGLGMALLSAAQNNDYPLIQGAALIVSVTVLIANFTVDILIGFFDPRVKAGRTGA